MCSRLAALPRPTATALVAFGTFLSAIVAGAQTARDSAGIQIVTSTKPAWTAAQQLRLSATPSLIIGDRNEEPYLLSRVRGGFRLSDGRIVLAEAQANELRFYSANGTHIKTVGHKGAGPGEFREMGSVHRLAGDSIAVLHDGNSISLFTGAGVFIRRTGSASPISGEGQKMMLRSVALPMNGALRLMLSMPLRQKAGAVGIRSDATAQHEIVDANEKVQSSMGELPFMQMISEKDGPGKPWLGAEEIFVGNGSSFLLGYGTQYELRKYSSQGKLQLIVRRAWTPAPITKSDIEVFVEEWLVRWSKTPGPERDKDRKDMLDDNYAKTLPAFSALVLDNTGRIWARTPKAIDGAVAGSLNNYPIGASTWSVFGTDGRWQGDVTMPARFTPTDIGADYVMGIARDADGVPTIVSYKLGTK